MRENVYQRRLIRKVDAMFDGQALIVKNDAGYQQGILDLTVFYGPRWGMLEVKASALAPHRPNQDYWVQRMDEMGFAAFIYPENETEVLYALREALQPRR